MVFYSHGSAILGSELVQNGAVMIQSEDSYIRVEEQYDVTDRVQKGLISVVTDGNTMMEFRGEDYRVEVL
eukprot:COSAG01_NODE_68431_length_264_cov_0.624242_1_plen_69_part_01